MTYRNNLFTCLWVLTWGGSLACAMASEVKLPPEFTIPWNIAPKDSFVEKDFVVTQYRWYRVDIAFKSTRSHANAFEETARMKQFAGNGVHGVVTKESANTDHPVWIIPHTVEEDRQMFEGIRQGIYVRKSGDPGVIVPVHLTIEQVDNAGATITHTDQVLETENFYAAGIDGLIRKVASIKLRPGTYRLKVKTTKESPLPPDIATSLRIAPSPNTRALKDDE